MVKKRTRGVWMLVITFLLALTISNNVYATENQNNASTISLNKKSLDLKVEDYYILKLNGVEDKEVIIQLDPWTTTTEIIKPEITYSSSNKKVATVNTKGMVTAKSPGSCKINVKHEGVTYTCDVKVKACLSKTKVTLDKKWKYPIKLKGVKTSKVKFSSSNKKIATVNSKGVITTKKYGKCKIKAKYKNKTYVCNVTVKKEKAPKYGDWTLDDNKTSYSKYIWCPVTIEWTWVEDLQEWLASGRSRFGRGTKKDEATCCKIAEKVLYPGYPGEYDGQKTKKMVIYIYLNEGKW